MTIFASLANNTKTNQLQVMGMGASKSAASRFANRAAQDVYGKRREEIAEMYLIEFESMSDLREYVDRVNKH